MLEDTKKADGQPDGVDRSLLLAGACLGPLFYLVVLAQMATREPFSIRIHPLSLLELGPGGWIQSLNFGVCGLLAGVFALGVLRRRQGWLLSVLFLISGIGLLIVARFPPDPYLGFPPGAPQPATMSNSAKLHGLGFMLTFVPLSVASLLAALRARRKRRGLAAVSLAAFILVPTVIGLGFGVPALTSIAFFVAGVVSFGWLTIFALNLASGRVGDAASVAG